MSVFKKYPHISNLHKEQDILTCVEVVSCEKVHGTNFRVMIPGDGGVPLFGSRNNIVGLGGGFFGDRPINWFLEVEQGHLLTRVKRVEESAIRIYPGKDLIMFGEFFGSGVQNGVSYVTDQSTHFLAFDVMVDGTLIDFDEFVTFCLAADVPMVPVVYRGAPTLEALNSLLEQDSVVAKAHGVEGRNISEGVVIRPTKMILNRFGEYVMVKHKSLSFAEEMMGKKGPAPLKAYNPCLDIATRYVTRGRVLNALDKAKEQGLKIINDMHDMKVLPEVVYQDVCLAMSECDDGSQTCFDMIDARALRSACTKVTGVVYSSLLRESLEVVVK